MSEAHTDSAESSTTTSFSLTTQVKERFGEWIVVLRNSKAIDSNKWRIFHSLTELYILYCALFIPTMRNYGYGEYGQIMFSILDFPMHFLLHWIQYEESFIVSGLFVGFLVLAYGLLFVTTWAFSKGKPFRKNLRSPLIIIMYLSRMLFPLFIHQVIGYMDCSLTHTVPYTSKNTLNRYSTIACSESPNSILIGLSVTFLFFLLLFVIVSEMICSDMHPMSRHIFTHDNYWTMVLLRVCSFMSVLIMFLIPIEYSYISSIVNMALSLIALIILFKTLPFYRSISSSIVFGVYCGALTSSCGTLITFFITSLALNTPNTSSPLFKEVSVGLSGFIVILAVLGFLGGLSFLVLYQRQLRKTILREVLKMRSVYRQILPEESNVALSPNAASTGRENNFLTVHRTPVKRLSIDIQSSYTTADSAYQQFMLNARASVKQYKKGLLLLLRSDLVETSNTTKDLNGETVQIHEITMRLCKNILQRGFGDRQVMETVAMLFAYRHICTSSSLTVAVELLLKSQKYSNLLTHNFSSIKITEIQSLEEAHKSEGIISRGYSKIQLIKKNSELIIALHKDFFKELMNDPIKVSSLRNIINKISELTMESEQVFKQLLSRKTKKILSLYASFVEIVYFDKEGAHALYLEANAMEEQKPVKLQKYKTSRIMPQPMSKDDNLSEQGSFQKRASFFSDAEFAHQQLLDDVLEESASVAGAGGELKKDYLFRNALKTLKSNTATKSFYAIFLLLGGFIILGSIGLSTYQGAIIKKNIVNLRLICVPQISPISTIRNLRAFQNWVNMFVLNEYSWPEQRHGFLNEYITVSFALKNHFT